MYIFKPGETHSSPNNRKLFYDVIKDAHYKFNSSSGNNFRESSLVYPILSNIINVTRNNNRKPGQN